MVFSRAFVRYTIFGRELLHKEYIHLIIGFLFYVHPWVFFWVITRRVVSDASVNQVLSVDVNGLDQWRTISKGSPSSVWPGDGTGE